MGDAVDLAKTYAAARDKLIVEDPEILGGTPVMRGTRISVYSILGRLNGGDTVKDILEDHPTLSPEAVETAAIYARSHPLVGRPGTALVRRRLTLFIDECLSPPWLRA